MQGDKELTGTIMKQWRLYLVIQFISIFKTLENVYHNLVLQKISKKEQKQQKKQQQRNKITQVNDQKWLEHVHEMMAGGAREIRPPSNVVWTQFQTDGRLYNQAKSRNRYHALIPGESCHTRNDQTLHEYLQKKRDWIPQFRTDNCDRIRPTVVCTR